jgi:hypothetical protein
VVLLQVRPAVQEEEVTALTHLMQRQYVHRHFGCRHFFQIRFVYYVCTPNAYSIGIIYLCSVLAINVDSSFASPVAFRHSNWGPSPLRPPVDIFSSFWLVV